MLGVNSSFVGRSRRLSRILFSQFKLLSKGHLHSNDPFTSRFKDTLPSTSVAAASQDILLQNIRSARDSSEVLNAINRHCTIMNSQHGIQALKSLFTLQKSQSSRLSNGEVVKSKDFRRLCEVLKSQIRHIEINDLIDVLKCLGYLGVLSDAKIMSLIMGLISKQVNDLSLQHITFLDFIMKDFKKTPLVEALKIALPIVFEANLKTKCDFDNIPQLCDFLYFASKRKQMGKSIEVIMNAIMAKREQLLWKEARNVVIALCDSKYSGNYQLALCHALDILTDSINKMDFYEMESILGRLMTKYVESNDRLYYHEEFCNGCIQMAIERDYSFEQILWILKKIIKFNHNHLGLLEHIARKLEKEPWQLEQNGATGVINFLNAFSVADYRPANWDRIKSIVIKACQGLTEREDLPWLRILLDLSILDCWCDELLTKVFNQEFLSGFLNRDNRLDYIQLLLLDQASATLSPWAIKPRAPKQLIAPLTQMMGRHITDFPLQDALAHGLGGEQYVKTGVHTPLGHFIDHIVVMRKGGFPIAINLSSESQDQPVSTEDILVPSDGKMIAVLLVPLSMCAINTERVKGIFRLNVDSIRALGFEVATVLQPVWNTLPDFERIPYLMRLVQENIPSDKITDSVSS